jgi:hypothetical protein
MTTSFSKLSSIFPMVLAIVGIWQETYCQRIQIGTDNHLTSGAPVEIKIACPIDTVSKMSGDVKYLLFANTKINSGRKSFGAYNTNTGYFSQSLTVNPLRLTEGIHSFYISFPDSLTRAYSAVVLQPQVPDLAPNLFERPKLLVAGQVYADLVQLLKKKLNDAIPEEIVATIPAGFKGVLCVEFFKNEYSENNNDQYYCTMTKYLGSRGANPEPNATDSFFTNFLQINAADPLFLLINSNWQAQNVTIRDVTAFGDKTRYAFIKHATEDVNTKIQIGTNESDARFKRILIFINN